MNGSVEKPNFSSREEYEAWKEARQAFLSQQASIPLNHPESIAGKVEIGALMGEIFGERAARMRIVREELLVDWDGRLVNPMLAASASASHAARTFR